MSFILLLSIVFILSGGSITTKYGITIDKTINQNETDLKKINHLTYFFIVEEENSRKTPQSSHSVPDGQDNFLFVRCFLYALFHISLLDLAIP